MGIIIATSKGYDNKIKCQKTKGKSRMVHSSVIQGAVTRIEATLNWGLLIQGLCLASCQDHAWMGPNLRGGRGGSLAQGKDKGIG